MSTEDALLCKFIPLGSNTLMSITSDYDWILALLFESSRIGRLEGTLFFLSTVSGTVSVTWRNAMCNTSGLTAPGSRNTWQMCKRQRWILKCPQQYCGTWAFNFRAKPFPTSPSDVGVNYKVPRLFFARCICDTRPSVTYLMREKNKRLEGEL